jgi:beta-lactamase regulating signal transducer with metallopeptidase domain/protocatechuate 3,4-dioxygenase beta subunit
MSAMVEAVVGTVNGLGAGFCRAGLAMLVQSSLLIAGLLVVDRLALRRRARAVVRYAVWLLVLVKLVLPPTLTSPVSLGRFLGACLPARAVPWVSDAGAAAAEPSRPAAAAESPVPAGEHGLLQASGEPQALALPDASTVAQPSSALPAAAGVRARHWSASLDWQGWFLLGWLAGVLGFAACLANQARALRRTVRTVSAPTAEHLRLLTQCCELLHLRDGTCRLGLSSRVPVPAVYGLARPRILLPTTLAQRLPPAQLRLVLLHELAHVKRRDIWIHLAQTVLQVAYWWHPLVWVANREIRDTREQAVDESVLVATQGQAPEYSRALVDVAAATLFRPPLGVGLLGVVESRTRVGQRIRHVLAFPSPRSARLGRAQLLALAAIGIVAVPLGLGQRAPDPKPAAAVVPDQVKCSGVVSDANGQPLEGAAVTCYRVRYDLRTPQVSGREEVRTGADGRFSFVGERLGPGVPSEHAVVVAWKEGLALGGGDWGLDSDRELAITLGPAAAISGTVVDTADRPLAEVAVRASVLVTGAPAATQWLPGFLMPERLGARTDAAGHFTIGWLPPGATAEFLASLPGYGTLHTFEPTRAAAILHYKAGQTDVKLVLPPEATVAGVVRAAAGGTPVADLLLCLRNAEGTDWYAANEPVRTAADGRFRFRGLGAGRYKLETNAAFDPTTEWCAVPMAITLAAGQAMADVGLKVEKGGLLELSLVDADTGAPVGGAMVTVDRPRDTAEVELPGMSWSLHGQSNQAGVARLRLWPGEYDLMRQVYGSGYGSSQEMTRISVAPGATIRQTVQLRKQSSITGTGRDAKGDPVVGAKVTVLPGGAGQAATSDAQGRFQATWDPNWGGMNPSPRPFLVARHFERHLAVMLEMPANAGEVDLTLDPGVVVSGRVVDEQGKAIEGALVDLMYDGGAWMSPLGLGSPMRATDAQGRYEIPAVPAHRKFRVWATRESAGAAGMGTEERPIEVDTETAVDGRVTAPDLVLKTPNLTVSGTVVDGTGKPVAGAEVMVFGVGQVFRRTTTDGKGRFVVEKVCAGEVHLQASRGLSGDRPAQAGAARVVPTQGLVGKATAQGGDQDLLIELGPPSSVRAQWPRNMPRIPVPELGRDFQPERAFYWADFQDRAKVGECWSHRETDVLPGGDKWVLGRFGSHFGKDRVSLTLTGLPEHRFVRLYFELYTLNSWDGHRAGVPGPDLWEARVKDGPRLVYASFANYEAPQSYPLPFGLAETIGSVGGRRFRAELPYAAGQTWGDHVVYPMCFTVPHTAAELCLQFAGIGLEPVTNESWALDNVGVELLDANPPRELTTEQLDQAWEDLAGTDVAAAYGAIQTLAAAGDQSVAFLAARLGWQPDAESRRQLAEMIGALAHNDRAQWDEVAQEIQAAGPHFFPAVFAAVDRRRFGPKPPPWLSEVFDGWTPPQDAGPEELREGRASHVLECVWTPTARQVLLFE